MVESPIEGNGEGRKRFLSHACPAEIEETYRVNQMGFSGDQQNKLNMQHQFMLPESNAFQSNHAQVTSHYSNQAQHVIRTSPKLESIQEEESVSQAYSGRFAIPSRQQRHSFDITQTVQQTPERLIANLPQNQFFNSAMNNKQMPME